MLLNPDGVFSIGASVSARGADVVLVDFSGAIRQHRQIDQRGVTTAEIQDSVAAAIAEIAALAPEGSVGQS